MTAFGPAPVVARPARPPVSRRVVPAADVSGAYALDLGAGGVLLSSPLAMQHVADALAGAVRAQRSAGVPVPPEVLDLAALLGRRLAAHRDRATEHFRLRQAALPQDPDPAPWTPAPAQMTVPEAAEVLGVTARQVRALAASGALTARKAAGAWHLDAAAVLAAADDRREHQP